MAHKKKITKSSSGTKMKMYFHAGTHDAIVKFQSEEDDLAREDIYVQEILPAFDKLVENLIFIQGFNVNHGNFDDLKSDCITFLFETLKKFDATRGTKAFSYFNVVAKNWLIVKSRQRAKAAKRMCSIDDKDAINEIGQKMMAVITDYAEEGGYSVVLDVSSPQTPVLYADQPSNITQAVIDAYNKVHAAAAAPAAAPAAAAAPAPKPAAAPAAAAPKPAAAPKQ